MITVSVKDLLSAIEEAEEFNLPEMNEGTKYLYDELYGNTAKGMEIHLSELDFDRFKLDDVDTMRDIYFNTLEANEEKSADFTSKLMNLPPVAAASRFV